MSAGAIPVVEEYINWSMGLPEKEDPACADQLSVVNAIFTQKCDLIILGLTRWRTAVILETVAVSGKRESCK